VQGIHFRARRTVDGQSGNRCRGRQPRQLLVAKLEADMFRRGNSGDAALEGAIEAALRSK
jgi:hypothetical protein